MHSVGPRIIILCQFGRQVARSLNPYFGRQVATWTDANSTDRSHVGTDPVSVRPIRQVGMNIWADRSEYIMRSVDRIGIDSDRHGVCPYMRAERPSWHGVGRDNDKNPFHKVQNDRDDGNIDFVDMQNHPYINNTLSYAVDSSMTDGAGHFYAVDFIMTDGIGCFYTVDFTMTKGVGHFYAVDFIMTDGVGRFYAVDFTATKVLVISTP